MAAGTVISGGFPGRVAQEVQPNPKCNGCLHFDGQLGKTGVCTIGSKPWNCGDGDHADIGYAPLARGAGTYLSGMNAHPSRATEAGDQDTADLYGVGSTRAITFQQVTLGDEHVHFVKSFITAHTSLQKSMCRLCQSNGIIGTAPANVGYQLCSCAPVEARTVAKALMQKLSNRERAVIDLSDLTAFVYDVVKAGFKLAKGTFYHAHGKYEVSPAGGGKHHVDFHPKGGGEKARVGTFDSHKEARRASDVHASRFAQGSTPQQKEAAAVEIAPGWHALAGRSGEKKTSVETPKAKKESIPSLAGAKDVRVKSEGGVKIPRGEHSDAARQATNTANSTGTRISHEKARDAHVRAAKKASDSSTRSFHEAHAQYHSQVLHSGDVKGGHTEKSDDDFDLVKSEDSEEIDKGLGWKVDTRHDATGAAHARVHHGEYTIAKQGSGWSASYRPNESAKAQGFYSHKIHPEGGKGGHRDGSQHHPTVKHALAAIEKHHTRATRDYKKSIGEEIEKGPARPRKTVATAPEVPHTEKPYQTRFKRPDDSPKTETPKSKPFDIDTSKLRARGEAGAKKLMTQNTPRSDDGHAERVGKEAFATRTEHKAPRSSVAPSPNRPGQKPSSAPAMSSAPKPAAAPSAPKPAPSKHIDMEEGMSESQKYVGRGAAPSSKPATSVPSMSTMPKKEEASAPRVSYKSVDEVADAIRKAVADVAKSDVTTPHTSHFKAPHGKYKVESDHASGSHTVHYTPTDHPHAPQQSVKMKDHDHAVKMAKVHAFVNNHSADHTHATIHEDHVAIHIPGDEHPTKVRSMKAAREHLGY